MDFEKRVYKYPITAIIRHKDILDDNLLDCSFEDT
jgi:hypothetical protein